MRYNAVLRFKDGTMRPAPLAANINDGVGDVVFYFASKPRCVEAILFGGNTYRPVGKVAKSSGIRQVRKMWKYQVELVR